MKSGRAIRSNQRAIWPLEFDVDESQVSRLPPTRIRPDATGRAGRLAVRERYRNAGLDVTLESLAEVWPSLPEEDRDVLRQDAVEGLGLLKQILDEEVDE